MPHSWLHPTNCTNAGTAWIMIWEFCTRCGTPAPFPLSRVINSILLSLLSAVCIFYIQNYWSSYSYEAAHRTGHILRYTTSLNLQPEYHLQKVKNPTAIPAKKILWLKELPVWTNTLKTPCAEQIWLVFYSDAFCQGSIQWEQVTIWTLIQLATFPPVFSMSTQEIAH